MKIDIVVNTFPYEEKKLIRLKEDFPDINFHYVKSGEEYKEKLPEADAVFTIVFKGEHLELANNLKWIQGLLAGVDSFPLEGIEKKGIILTTGRGIHKNHMSEYALSMMIVDARSLDKLILNQEKKEWDSKIKQDEIRGKTLGIIGLGSIGKEIARKASFMGMEVIGIKRNYTPVPHVKKVYTNKDIDELVKQSDYIINLLPLTPETENYIGKEIFDKMKPSACMMNLGRGKTVNEEELYEALKNKVFRKYISDVFAREPLPKDSPLWDLDNIIITPHICGPNVNYMDKAYEIVKENMEKYLENPNLMINQYSFKERY